MSVPNPSLRRRLPGREPRPSAGLSPRATALLTIGIAIALFGAAAAALAFSPSTKLTALAAVVAMLASAWLLGLALRTVRVESQVFTPPGEPRPRQRVPLPHSVRTPLGAEPLGAGETRVGEAAAGGRAAIEEALTDERRAAIERVRRLTESSFLAGSNALVNVRTVLRGLQDCRERLSELALRSETGGDQDPSAQFVARVFESLLADIERLGACARLLQPLAEAASTAAASTAGSTSGSPPGQGPTPGPPSAHRGILLAKLKLRGLAAELEHGLLGLGTEVRVLQRARLTRPSLNGKAGQRRGASAAPWGRVLERLEAQVGELADQVAGFTRDAEHLSRELDQLQVPSSK